MILATIKLRKVVDQISYDLSTESQILVRCPSALEWIKLDNIAKTCSHNPHFKAKLYWLSMNILLRTMTTKIRNHALVNTKDLLRVKVGQACGVDVIQ